MKIKIGFGKNKILVNARKLSLVKQAAGLMFRTRECDNLLFDRGGRWVIHSIFVFFPFLAVWLDEGNNVVEWKVVKPFTFSVLPRNDFAKLVEIPINKKNEGVIRFLSTEKGKV